MWQRFSRQLATPVSAQSLGFFRMSFGAIMLLFCLRMLFTYNGVAWYDLFFAADAYTFRYTGFEWVHPISRGWFSMLVNVLCISCLLVSVGLYYRIACLVMFLAWTYIFLLEKSYYNNHYYLMSLIAFLLLFMPADAAFSMDRWLRSSPQKREPRSRIPFWPIFLLRAQMFFVYFFAGVTKLNAEWLLSAAPLRVYLSNPAVLAPYRPYLSEGLYEFVSLNMKSQWLAFFLSYTGTIYDLAIGFLLLFRRTRLLGFALTVVFHGVNHFLLFDDIDVFPLMAVAATTIFLEPDWPRRVWFWIRQRRFVKPDWGWFFAGLILLPGIGALLGWKIRPTSGSKEHRLQLPVWVVPLVIVWVATQALIPLRHYLIPGDVNWTQEGELFSWRVKAAIRDARTTRFAVVDPDLLKVVDGQVQANWKSLEIPPKIYIDLDADYLDWGKLPAILAVFEPNTGERLIFNPWFGNRTTPMTEQEGREWIKTYWQEKYGHQPQSVETCKSLDQTFATIVSLVDFERLGRSFQEPVEAATAAAKKLNETEVTPKERQGALAKINNFHTALLQVGPIQTEVLAALRRAEPLVHSGAKPSGGTMLVIRDEALLGKPTSAGHLDPYAVVGPEVEAKPLEVFTIVNGLSAFDLRQLPKLMVLRDSFRGTYIYWNTFKEVQHYQARRLMSGPLPCQEYAVHIAEWWEAKYGRRPEVFVEMWMTLHSHSEQLAIDPDVDLSTAQGVWFGHHPWIYQLGDEKGLQRGNQRLTAE